MDEMTQLLVVYAATAHMFRCMMATTIGSRKRKRHGHAPIGRISYGPIEDRDRSRLTTLIIRFGRTMLFVSICLELLEHRSFVFVILFGSVVYWKTLFICVLSSKLLCFCIP
jgi:hypothetical protein